MNIVPLTYLVLADMMGRARDPRTLCEDNNGFGGSVGFAVSGSDSRFDGTEVMVLRILQAEQPNFENCIKNDNCRKILGTQKW